MTRRTILKGILALSAFIAVPSLVTSVEAGNISAFQDGIDKGVMENMNFYFTHPIALEDVENDLIIKNCNFTFDYKSDKTCIVFKNCDGLKMLGCKIEKLQQPAKCCIEVKGDYTGTNNRVYPTK